MGDTVQLAYSAARRWQENLLWIRVNVGYMMAELDYIREEGGLDEPVENLLLDFGQYYRTFLNEELEVFTFARRLESGDSSANRQGIADALKRMKVAFIPWFGSLNDLVAAHGDEEPMDPGLALLMCCGAEMIKAHTEYRRVVTAFQEQVSA